jgi:hypothetical protein
MSQKQKGGKVNEHLEPTLFYDPTVVALNYLGTKAKPVHETDLMIDLHSIINNLLRDNVNIEVIENSNPFCPYWNPQVSDGLNDLSEIDIIAIKERSLEDTKSDVCYTLGPKFHSFLERVNGEVEPEVKAKIEKYINLVGHK